MNANDKERCVLFYERWWHQLQRLPADERLQVYESIMRFAFRGEETNMVYYLESIMDNIRATITLNENRKRTFSQMQRDKSRLAVEARRTRQNALAMVSHTLNKAECSNSAPKSADLPVGDLGDPVQPVGNPTHPNKKENKKENKKNTDVVGIRKDASSSPPPTMKDTSLDDDMTKSIEALWNDSSWADVVMMRYYISRKELHDWLEAFCLDCRANGKTIHNNRSDLKSHFCSWLRIQTEKLRANNHGKISQQALGDNSVIVRRKGTEPTARTAEEYTTRL